MKRPKPIRPPSNAGRHAKHENDQKVFDFIVAFKYENDGLSPTLREIADSLGLSSTSVVSGIVHRLESKGRLVIWDEVSRGIKVVGGKWGIEDA